MVIPTVLWRRVTSSQSTPTLLALVVSACGGSATPATSSGNAGHFVVTSAAELVGPDVLSSAYSEVRLTVSPDGQTALWGSTDRTGGPGGWNIWVSHKTGATWGEPTAAPFDSDANDFDPAFSPDGAFVYFFSNRPGGAGGDDIYRAPVIAAPGGFGPAEHLGPEINTPGDEWAPIISPDGRHLLFATNRPGAKHDLYLADVVSNGTGAGFAPAQPVPGALNTPADEFDATFLADGSSLVFARSTDVENDPIQLFVATRGATGYDAGTPLSDAVNVAGGYALGPTIDWQDRDILYFSAIRPEAKRGKLDLYRVRYQLTAR